MSATTKISLGMSFYTGRAKEEKQILAPLFSTFLPGIDQVAL
ncbi:hypothetical protein [Paenibacillus larvae]|nr:hypothetical protein [Paenibacillus larvae]MDT2190995.1 hypothetical protein [Paenibacillus larvae]